MPHATEMLQIALEAFQIARVLVSNDLLTWSIDVAIIYLYSYHYYLQSYRIFHSLLHLSLIILTTAIIYTVAGAKGMFVAWVIAALCDFKEDY